jgi:iron-sulfur cluster repair protein YtfE (RIC family)
MAINMLACPAIENHRRDDDAIRSFALDRASRPEVRDGSLAAGTRDQGEDPCGMRSAARLCCGQSLRELVKELATAHHPSLRQRLLAMESLLDGAISGTAKSLGTAVGRRLSLLHGEVACSLLRAEHVAFPQILELADAVESNLSSMSCFQQNIQRAACSLEAEHATALQAIWGLLRLADRMDAVNDSAARQAFWSALSEFSAEFYSYLHELHSVLFQLVGRLT